MSDGEEAFYTGTLTGGEQYVLVAGAGSDEGAYELRFDRLTELVLTCSVLSAVPSRRPSAGGACPMGSCRLLHGDDTGVSESMWLGYAVTMREPRTPPPPTRREWIRFFTFFGLTFCSVFVSYGWWWSGSDPFTDARAFSDSLLFALGLMGILGAHEAGHYVVARRHGMDQTLPFFIPFPLAFGTLGAIIRLRTPPRTRSALLEMGAAGPLAGFAVALVVLALGLPGTVGHAMPEVVLQWPPPPPEQPGLFVQALGRVLSAVAALFPAIDTVDGLPLTIMANPPVMDLMGMAVIGEVPGRYDRAHTARPGRLGWLLPDGHELATHRAT